MSGSVTPSESLEKLEYLLHLYECHLSSHRLKHTHGTLRVIVTTTATLLENALQLKLSKLAETIFDLLKGRAEFMEGYRNLPGKEVGHISDVHARVVISM